MFNWLGSFIIFIAVFATPNAASADLVYDGVPEPQGREIGNAAAVFLTSITWFFESLARWEGPTLEENATAKKERIERARKAFDNYIATLKEASKRFNRILDAPSEELGNILERPLPNPQSQTINGEDIGTVLGKYGYERPETYRDIVLIGIRETNALIEVSEENGFQNKVEEFRHSVYSINEAVARAIRVGLAVGAFTTE